MTLDMLVQTLGEPPSNGSLSAPQLFLCGGIDDAESGTYITVRSKKTALYTERRQHVVYFNDVNDLVKKVQQREITREIAMQPVLSVPE